MNQELISFLEQTAYHVRVNSLLMTTAAGSGHPSSALSAADIMAVCFFYAMNFDPNDNENPNNDRFILSKGHAAPALYAIFEQLGILSKQQLLTYRQFDSLLEGHPTSRFTWAQAATGSLGQGLSIGLGIALAGVIDKRTYHTFVLMGDGEIAEGSIWEAAAVAARYSLHNLIGIVDVNRLGQSDESIDDWRLDIITDKFRAFGWHSTIVDGHDIIALMKAFDTAKKITDKPCVIVAKTFKGAGVSLMQDKLGFHGKALKQDELKPALDALKKNFELGHREDNYTWKAQLPIYNAKISVRSEEEKKSKRTRAEIILPVCPFKSGESIATRKAFGIALEVAGGLEQSIIVLDGDVKNSTFTELFEKKFSERFIQSYIAEQNMIGMAVGLAQRHKIPVAATFGSFMTRAFDQIRMAAIGKATLRLCGSHAGVSIGEDGPSQMALEDIAMFNAIPGSIILYPADGMSAYKLTELMLNNYDGISYLRTTRPETPIIYSGHEEFRVGGCKILRESERDKVCIIAAGITLHEALKAYEQLKKENILVCVIDAYCIKPFDISTIEKIANKTRHVITVEDHYLQGGLGQTVAFALRNIDIKIECLAVTKIPRSGKPAQLLAWACIDCEAIISTAKNILSENIA